MKRCCSRPYYLTLSMQMCSYLGARQQQLLDHQLRPGDPLPGEEVGDTLLVVDFWRRVCSAYRNDGCLLPSEANDSQPILGDDAVAAVTELLSPSSAEEKKKVGRLAATLELYCFILHGEQRDGIFAHGPYPLSDGSHLLIHEFTDLQNDYLPWAATQTRNVYPNIAVVRRVRPEVTMKFDLFGGVLVSCADLAPYTLAEAVFTCGEDGQPRALQAEELVEVQQRAAQAQTELYLGALEWSARYKIEYGVHLFANHLRSFFILAGLDSSWDRRIRLAFESVAAACLDQLLASAELPSMWRHMADPNEELFWPVIPAEQTIKTPVAGRTA